jgi:class 3 adenylate cyclase
MIPPPDGVVTYLMTDIVGSAALWERHREQMNVALLQHDRIIASAVDGNDGLLVKHRGEGDSTLSVFIRATGAARAAFSAQLQIKDAAWPPGVVLRVRMAVHTGEDVSRDGDYYGLTITRAARIRAIADGGQILCSRVTADIIADSLTSTTELHDIGLRALEGLARPEHIYALEAGQPRPAVTRPPSPETRFASIGATGTKYRRRTCRAGRLL